MGAAILNFMTRYGCRYCYSLEVFLCETIGHLHDGVILLQLPEFISFSFSNSNFVIPGESKEQ